MTTCKTFSMEQPVRPSPSEAERSSRRMVDIISPFQNAGEDWSGLKDPRARRKLQTRLNMRAHRRRKAAHDSSHAPKWKSSESALSQRSDTKSKSSALFACCMLPEVRDPTYLDAAVFEAKSDQAGPWSIAPIDSKGCCPVVQIPGVSHYGGDFFPMSLDHLIRMIEYNLIRAFVTNAAILDILHLLPSSETCPPLHDRMLLFPVGGARRIPETLQPSYLQRSTDHAYGIDLWPDAKMRDNIIVAVASGLLDQHELEADLLGTVCPNTVIQNRNAGSRGDGLTAKIPSEEEERVCGVVVWTTPWCADGYELSEAFIRKYRWLLRGCYDLLRATNRWRATRGEDPIVVEL
ncbi:hypothetical protein M409DRAFT_58336 [Zasmidium cellare ATCC 36951]|uniref:BZIP domain-containing protein n=1 Tax=Zasmidium cellare ATCC 36951 TaxID=1080233 RepID=A0A6A6C5D0_ZASCE|nr:uncharacterized protein M409DRAFT_58336 [Zasmidium cellare ATCC 36951]KAF2162215.1 hypothetical protein M409DRAFT_58336 [Zasmidium cellare ATCC 36951]